MSLPIRSRADAGLEGEIKQVTVMFVDIVESMVLCERLGADRWRRLLDRFFSLATAAVHSVDGTVDKFTGDGIMAIFGAPIAYEDHAQRACLASLDLHAALLPFQSELAESHVDLRTRVGLHSGEVVVGKIGYDQRMAYTAIGHTVGVAARMEALAPPGSTAVSQGTADLIRGRFTLSVLDHRREIRGVTGAQTVYELLGRGSTTGDLQTRSERGQLSRYVGRHTELAALDAALASIRLGHGRVVGIAGEPGVGKSRLVLELARRCAAEGLRLVQAGAAAYGRRTPLAPVLGLLRAAFLVRDDDPPEVAQRRVTEALQTLSWAQEADLPLLWDFLGVPDVHQPTASLDPEARQRRLLTLVADLIRARCRLEPLVIVLEDLHWLDDASRSFLPELVATAADTPLLLALTYRPEYGSIRADSPHQQELTLAPLDPDATSELLVDLLGNDPSLTALRAECAERSAGNPFFAEELVQALVGSDRLAGARGQRRLVDGATKIVLPPTVQAALAARIDVLSSRDKDVLLVAAVIGTSTDRRLLAQVSGITGIDLDQALLQLIEANLLIERPSGSADQYDFRHPLIQEVAYRGQVDARRARLHGRVVDEMVQIYADRLDERSSVLAHHAENAHRPAAAAIWHAQAAAWIATTSPPEAMRHWQAARRLADGLPEGEDRSGLIVVCVLGILTQAWRLGSPHEVARNAHAEAVALLADDQREGHLRILLDFALCANLCFCGRLGTALELARRNSARALAQDDAALVVLTAGAHWYAALSAGKPREGFDAASRALQRADGDVRIGMDLGAFDSPYGLVLLGRGYCASFLGNSAEGAADIRAAVALGQEQGGCDIVPIGLSALAFVEAMTGDAAGALTSAQASLEAAERAGSFLSISGAWIALVWAGLATGDHDLAERAAREVLQGGRDRGLGVELATFAYSALSETALSRGELAAAEAAARLAVTTALTPSPSWGELVARARLAQVLVRRPETAAQAHAELSRAVALAKTYQITLCDPLLDQARESMTAATRIPIAQQRSKPRTSRRSKRTDA